MEFNNWKYFYCVYNTREFFNVSLLYHWFIVLDILQQNPRKSLSKNLDSFREYTLYCFTVLYSLRCFYCLWNTLDSFLNVSLGCYFILANILKDSSRKGLSKNLKFFPWTFFTMKSNNECICCGVHSKNAVVWRQS